MHPQDYQHAELCMLMALAVLTATPALQAGARDSSSPGSTHTSSSSASAPRKATSMQPAQQANPPQGKKHRQQQLQQPEGPHAHDAEQAQWQQACTAVQGMPPSWSQFVRQLGCSEKALLWVAVACTSQTMLSSFARELLFHVQYFGSATEQCIMGCGAFRGPVPYTTQYTALYQLLPAVILSWAN